MTGKKLVLGYTYAVGDLLHIGHINYFRSAKQLCDRLIVGVLTDKACMEVKPKPIVPFNERIQIISSIRYVDAAVAQETYSPFNNIKSVKPDILIESDSHTVVEKNPYGRVVVLPYFPAQSSTKIKRKIININIK